MMKVEVAFEGFSGSLASRAAVENSTGSVGAEAIPVSLSATTRAK